MPPLVVSCMLYARNGALPSKISFPAISKPNVCIPAAPGMYDPIPATPTLSDPEPGGLITEVLSISGSVSAVLGNGQHVAHSF